MHCAKPSVPFFHTDTRPVECANRGLAKPLLPSSCVGSTAECPPSPLQPTFLGANLPRHPAPIPLGSQCLYSRDFQADGNLWTAGPRSDNISVRSYHEIIYFAVANERRPKRTRLPCSAGPKWQPCRGLPDRPAGLARRRTLVD